MPDLSVVIPTFDTASMTLRCCRAVMASMPEGSEVIVADDGSTDGTAALLAHEVPGVRVVRLETNRGFAAAANRGVGAARGDIILLLNSDAVVEAGALRAIVAAFDDDARLGVAGARLLNDDGTPQWSGGRTPTLPWMIGVVSGAGPVLSKFAPLIRRFAAPFDSLRSLVAGSSPRKRGEGHSIGSRREPLAPHVGRVLNPSAAEGGRFRGRGRVENPSHIHSGERVAEGRVRGIDWVSGAAMAFRRQVWSDAGPLSERFRFYCQDIELCLRARHAGWGVRIIDDARVAHTLGGTVSAGHPLRHDPARLWPDLLAWGTAHYGRTWSMLARPALVAAAAARVVWSAVRRDPATGALVRGLRSLVWR